MKMSKIACRIAGMLGRGGGPPTLFFRPAVLRRRALWIGVEADPSSNRRSDLKKFGE